MKFDMHIHSSLSRDGSISPRNVLKQCKRIGFAGCSITDHNQIQGALQAASLAKEEGLLVLKAVEVSATEGHVLAYGLNELVPRGLTVAETIDRIHESAGLAVAAHPRRFPSGVGLELAESGKFDAIEILNGGSSKRGNEKARRLAERKGSPKTAGSDAHKIHEIGKAYLEIECVTTEDELLDAIKRGRVRVGGRSRSRQEGIVYATETFFEWMRGSFRRL